MKTKMDIRIVWWNVLGRKKFRTIILPIGQIDLMPDDRIIIHPQGPVGIRAIGEKGEIIRLFGLRTKP